jgi:hypothetical protein
MMCYVEAALAIRACVWIFFLCCGFNFSAQVDLISVPFLSSCSPFPLFVFSGKQVGMVDGEMLNGSVYASLHPRTSLQSNGLIMVTGQRSWGFISSRISPLSLCRSCTRRVYWELLSRYRPGIYWPSFVTECAR